MKIAGGFHRDWLIGTRRALRLQRAGKGIETMNDTRHFVRGLAALAAAASFGAPSAALAESNLVVVELFTSQGCSSCPPADALLEQMAKNAEVLPLAFHVDYWDYLGWTDKFSSPAFTQRQKDYAHAIGERSIYTPQAIVNGQSRMVGSDSQALMAALMHEMNRDESTQVSAALQGGTVNIVGKASAPINGTLEVILVRYLPESLVDILHGENAGKTIRYVNTVTSVSVIGQWAGQGDMTLSVPMSGSDAAAVLVQEAGMGTILAAALVN